MGSEQQKLWMMGRLEKNIFVGRLMQIYVWWWVGGCQEIEQRVYLLQNHEEINLIRDNVTV